jgi:hypothetical protein
MFQTSKEVRKYLPTFEHELLDLSALPDEAIQGEVMVRVVQLVLKHIFAKDLGARLPAILGLAAEVFQQASGLAMLVTILRYVSQAGPGVSDEELRQALETALPAEGGILKKTLAEQWLEQGREQGLEQGLEQGRAEGLAQGQRETLLLILRHRFQNSEAELARVAEHINQVKEVPRLVQWVNLALSADSLEAFVARMDDSPAQI